MQITIENTDQLAQLNGVPARIWQGQTDTGIKVIAFITRIAVNEKEDANQFEKELQQCSAPRVDVTHSFPLSLIL